MKLYKEYTDRDGKTKWVKKNFKELIESLHPCSICGHKHIRIDNSYGWTNAVIWCQNCKHHIEGKNLSETMDKWNEEYDKSEHKFEEAKEERKEMLETIKEINKEQEKYEYNPANGKGIRIKIEDEVFDTLKAAAQFLEIDCSDLNRRLHKNNPTTIKGLLVERLTNFRTNKKKTKDFCIINENTKETFESYKDCAKKYHIVAKDLKRYMELFGKFIMKTGEVLVLNNSKLNKVLDKPTLKVLNKETVNKEKTITEVKEIKQEIKEQTSVTKHEINNLVKASLYDALKTCAENKDIVMFNKLINLINE